MSHELIGCRMYFSVYAPYDKVFFRSLKNNTNQQFMKKLAKSYTIDFLLLVVFGGLRRF